MKTFENAKIGDKVWDIRLGWGEIIEIGYTILYPITVKFDSIIDKYTFEVGGKNKKKKQIAGIPHSFVVKDGILLGSGNIIPLHLFGFLY